MHAIAILLLAASLGYAVARALRVPALPLLLLAGVALSSTGLVQGELLEETLILGVAFLLFVTGIELNPARMRDQRKAAIQVGILQFWLLGAAGMLLSLALGFPLLEALYLALALTASSTLVVVRLLQQRRQMFEPFGRLVVGVLLVQDIFLILLMPVINRLPFGADAVLIGIGGSVLLVALTAASMRWLTPLIARLDGDDELVLLAALGVLFGYIGIADALGLPLVAGAFLAGVALSRFPVSGIVRSQLGSVGDFFSAVFFTALGALITLPTLGQLGNALALAALVIFITPPLVTWIAERTGFSARPALEAGLILAQMSELSLVLGLYGMLAEQISPDTFAVIALATVITMVLTPVIATNRVVWRLLRLHPLRVAVDVPVPPSGHVLVLGSGSTGMPLVETLFGSGTDVVVVDDDPAVIARLSEAEIPCLRGDAADAVMLEAAHVHQARIVTSTIRRPRDNRLLLRMAAGVPVFVRVFDREDADWVRTSGGTPILYSEAAAEAFMRWYAVWRGEVKRPGATDGAV